MPHDEPLPLRAEDWMIDTEELYRLIGRGLPTTVAMDVANGQLDEEFEVARWEAQRVARQWAADPANRSAKFKPLWDCEPSRYYLALDGEKTENIKAASLTIMDVQANELHCTLHHGSGRQDGPWSEPYTTKTATIAYRWANKMSVTPPLIRPHQDQIVIDGGMHRLHLAMHYGAQSMPVLVRKDEASNISLILPSASSR